MELTMLCILMSLMRYVSSNTELSPNVLFMDPIWLFLATIKECSGKDQLTFSEHSGNQKSLAWLDEREIQNVQA